MIDPYHLRFMTIDYNQLIYCLRPIYWSISRRKRLAAGLLPKRNNIEYMLLSFCEMHIVNLFDIIYSSSYLFVTVLSKSFFKNMKNRHDKLIATASLIIPHWLAFAIYLMVRIRSQSIAVTGIIERTLELKHDDHTKSRPLFTLRGCIKASLMKNERSIVWHIRRWLILCERTEYKNWINHK